TILADLASNVGGERVSVRSIAPRGAEIEEYSPKPEDAKTVSEARVIFTNGLALDAWSKDLLRNRKSDANVVVVTDGIPAIEDNPHMWFDVQLARRYVEKIRDALIAADANGADAYMKNASAYDAELVKLDGDLKNKAAEIPAPRRKLVTSHDAFPYFAKAYGFEIVGFVQPEPDKDPSPAELAALVETVKKAGVPVIFVESQASPRLSEALAKEAGVTKIVGDIPTDSLEAKPPADTYAGLLRTVMDRIVSALR
ncbi:MAG: zinc ABC transporter substrate-binding protein, partial [Chloroflexi bacterium]|nr:zinc ABC transporter substrate-binding protein [Chloroflexota bacterium]